MAIVEADQALAMTAGRLRRNSSGRLGDRFCLALARRDGLPALTADRQWRTVADAAGVTVAVIHLDLQKSGSTFQERQEPGSEKAGPDLNHVPDRAEIREFVRSTGHGTSTERLRRAQDRAYDAWLSGPCVWHCHSRCPKRQGHSIGGIWPKKASGPLAPKLSMRLPDPVVRSFADAPYAGGRARGQQLSRAGAQSKPPVLLIDGQVALPAPGLQPAKASNVLARGFQRRPRTNTSLCHSPARLVLMSLRSRCAPLADVRFS